jgi:hypothetical protein
MICHPYIYLSIYHRDPIPSAYLLFNRIILFGKNPSNPGDMLPRNTSRHVKIQNRIYSEKRTVETWVAASFEQAFPVMTQSLLQS